MLTWRVAGRGRDGGMSTTRCSDVRPARQAAAPLARGAGPPRGGARGAPDALALQLGAAAVHQPHQHVGALHLL